MDSHRLSARLAAVASFVPQGARLLDVGSDHAYLPLHLLEVGRINFAVAGEVVAGPYQSALNNVAASKHATQIAVRLADGLAAFEVEDAIDCITIAGMGGRLIADILEKGRAKLVSVDRMILQPNNREDDLRQWLSDHDFQILSETIIEEQGKFYEIMVVGHGQMQLDALDVRFGPQLRQAQTSIFTAKWLRELGKLEQTLLKIPVQNVQDRAALLQKIETIKEVCYVS